MTSDPESPPCGTVLRGCGNSERQAGPGWRARVTEQALIKLTSLLLNRGVSRQLPQALCRRAARHHASPPCLHKQASSKLLHVISLTTELGKERLRMAFPRLLSFISPELLLSIQECTPWAWRCGARDRLLLDPSHGRLWVVDSLTKCITHHSSPKHTVTLPYHTSPINNHWGNV